MTPDPARQAAYEAAGRAYCLTRFNYPPGVYLSAEYREKQITLDASATAEEDWLTAVVDAVWDLAVEEGRRQSRALDPEVAEVVADTIERWEKR